MSSLDLHEIILLKLKSANMFKSMKDEEAPCSIQECKSLSKEFFEFSDKM